MKKQKVAGTTPINPIVGMPEKNVLDRLIVEAEKSDGYAFYGMAFLALILLNFCFVVFLYVGWLSPFVRRLVANNAVFHLPFMFVLIVLSLYVIKMVEVVVRKAFIKKGILSSEEYFNSQLYIENEGWIFAFGKTSCTRGEFQKILIQEYPRYFRNGLTFEKSLAQENSAYAVFRAES